MNWNKLNELISKMESNDEQLFAFMFKVAIHTGIKVGTLLDLTWSDV